LITESKDNVFLVVIIMFRLFTILVSCCFCNRDITQSRCVGKLFHGFTYSERYVIVCLKCYVKYLSFDTFVRTCNENYNGILMWICGHIDTMSWIYLCGTLLWGCCIVNSYEDCTNERTSCVKLSFDTCV
jgi:hypothetical protein